MAREASPGRGEALTPPASSPAPAPRAGSYWRENNKSKGDKEADAGEKEKKKQVNKTYSQTLQSAHYGNCL